QRILVTIIVTLLVACIVLPFIPGLGSFQQALLALAILEPLFIIPLALLRSGHFTIASTATVAVFEVIVVLTVLARGPIAPSTGAAFAIPMTIAAVVLRRPGLVVVT